ncbi:MAG: MFS transporter [Zymomonas mobilis]|uniref:Major facilitator superfamily MFS_1 n=1 Tax=Zymomonas mobilis subsp. mobilis (strain ATCC 10988 / DSM 424 / LMG 404 / NCIMB 8938 / NRRL B-806 / ZM1) TaxID=555217 RepID=A0A0H3FXS6_ZYMMA|nr:MFS transporter [Zymomonas mobilis]ACV75644.1 major facilitator superfamily MFS_1 [Zymomonas mobilis subsp. mobilis NCIMB 11163]AEH62569.1 major facilitator superfamily MFS_1 [Zymomonas mobilis subsp. mobilis ATCC 10988]ART93560.1 MFS transporter [Zymomonas mobilis subsp. mobilis]MCP9308525.1 MFS transporter [Zymomonas mobilis]TQL27829.1 MFS transporter [Zymomonas mobilis]
MKASIRLLNKRRFLPLFVTQTLGAFNDNLFRTVVVLVATYGIYSNPQMETRFSALATGIFIIPFFLFSALAGQLADSHDKARIIRIVKIAEIAIMATGAIGLWGHSIPLMLIAVFAMGIHSTFFGPIKYAILPQHLKKDEVLGGTGLVEAGSYLAILGGTVVAGFVNSQIAGAVILLVALSGCYASKSIPDAKAEKEGEPIDHHIFRASYRLISATMHIPRLFLAICSISFFWAIGSVLIIQFPPLVKNLFYADKQVASLFLAIFSIGVAIGSVLINRLLCGKVSARYAPGSVLAMGASVLWFEQVIGRWHNIPVHRFFSVPEFIQQPGVILVFSALLAVAITGGMFVVPLYAFLTTTVEKDHTARTVAANNIMTSGAMVLGGFLAALASNSGFSTSQILYSVAGMCCVAAWLSWRLHCSCD